MKKRVICILSLVLTLLPLGMKAQSDSSYRTSFEKYKEEMYKEYNSFVEQTHSEFEAFLAEAWKEYNSFTGQTGAYSEQKPEVIPSLTVQSGVIDIEAPSLESALPSFEDEPENKNAVYTFDTDPSSIVAIRFYGVNTTFNVPLSLRLKAKGYREKQVAEYYTAMSKNDSGHALQHQLDQAVDRMGLNEWGYFVLLRDISEKLFDNTDDRVLFTFYMLHSHGFKARVGRGSKSEHLLLLLALDNSKEVYSETFFRINGYKYYIVYGQGLKKESVYSYDEKADHSGLKEIGLDFTKPLNLADCDKTRSLHLAKADMDIELPYSTSHLSYYDDIPTTVFPIYFKTPLSKEAEAVLAETFASLSKKYNKVQLVDIMLNFVQTAFAYRIDEQQFGREKYFFPEEVIGRPYSDCEDRSALFGWLVRHFIGYDVIGVLYKDHLATAVCFGDDALVMGKDVNYGGKRYVVCDPTYRNAAIGTVMPRFAKAKYEIVKIN